VETDPLEARSALTKYRVQGDTELQEMQGLNVVIVRHAFLYGPQAAAELGKTLMVGYLVQRADTLLPIAMDPTIDRNTVHTVDVARAMLHLSEWYITHNKQGAHVFNVADLSSTKIGDTARVVAEAYPFKYEFVIPPNVVPTPAPPHVLCDPCRSRLSRAGKK
jgi:nucleoside-diphosphate-sugar epimerase